MKKRAKILMFIMLGFCLAGCDNGQHKVDIVDTSVVNEEVTDMSSESADEVTIEDSEEIEAEIVEEPIEAIEEDYSDKEPVTIVLSMYTLTSGQTIEEYIADLEERNPGSKYEVYDEKHYSQEISYSDYIKAKEMFAEKTEIDAEIQKYFSDEQFDGAFISTEYDDLFQNITVYVDREKFDNNRFACYLGSLFFLSVYSDLCQAYNDIPPEERVGDIKYIDYETNEEIPVD